MDAEEREYFIKAGFCPKCDYAYDIFGCDLKRGVCNFTVYPPPPFPTLEKFVPKSAPASEEGRSGAVG